MHKSKREGLRRRTEKVRRIEERFKPYLFLATQKPVRKLSAWPRIGIGTTGSPVASCAVPGLIVNSSAYSLYCGLCEALLLRPLGLNYVQS